MLIEYSAKRYVALLTCSFTFSAWLFRTNGSRLDCCATKLDVDHIFVEFFLSSTLIKCFVVSKQNIKNSEFPCLRHIGHHTFLEDIMVAHIWLDKLIHIHIMKSTLHNGLRKSKC